MCIFLQCIKKIGDWGLAHVRTRYRYHNRIHVKKYDTKTRARRLQFQTKRNRGAQRFARKIMNSRKLAFAKTKNEWNTFPYCNWIDLQSLIHMSFKHLFERNFDIVISFIFFNTFSFYRRSIGHMIWFGIKAKMENHR